ncbi:MAG TPA: bifunctional 4-hydroxy-2-oxoglutarate aldolase/2-dehydro-3-deoxy-phosphogluconate aldolase [Bryobacteraceae bacterium]|nr:bifunctional 4-hydroxy-2-oxoglutarate aldolase/2-dehydro-3-deoxy-phosphogluconate aldolase [Bryobacteraceae bacterium]
MKTVRKPDSQKRDAVRAKIEEIGIIPAIRVSSAEDALFAAEAVANAGIPIVEVTMTVPGASKVIFELAQRNPEVIVGAGTVMDIETAQRCLDSGARFLTTTGLDLEIVEFARRKEVVVFPGALTPTEVLTAWKAGSDFVKIFPCAQVGGPSYIKALKGPFPELRLIASGGVTQSTAADFILAGAAAIGIGTHLVQPQAIKNRERDWIRELARRYVRMVQEARGQRNQ